MYFYLTMGVDIVSYDLDDRGWELSSPPIPIIPIIVYSHPFIGELSVGYIIFRSIWP